LRVAKAFDADCSSRVQENNRDWDEGATILEMQAGQQGKRPG